MIVELKNKEIWDKAAMSLGDFSSVSLLRGWLETLEKVYNYEICYLAAEEEKEIKSVMPIAFDRKKRELISLPFKFIGGITNALYCPQYFNFIDALAKKRGAKLIRINLPPFAFENNNLKQIFLENKYNVSLCSYYMMLKINKKSYAELTSSFHRSTKRNIKISNKLGVKTQVVGSNKENIDIFYNFYENIMKKNKAKHIFSQSFFMSLADNLKPYLQIRQSSLEDKVIASSIDFVFNKQIYIFFIVDNPKYRKYRPVSSIYENIIQYAVNNNLDYVNLGPSGFGDSNFIFKQRFGAIGTPAPYAIKSNSFFGQKKIDYSISLKNYLKTHQKLAGYAKKIIKS